MYKDAQGSKDDRTLYAVNVLKKKKKKLTKHFGFYLNRKKSCPVDRNTHKKSSYTFTRHRVSFQSTNYSIRDIYGQNFSQRLENSDALKFLISLIPDVIPNEISFFQTTCIKR